MPFVRSKLVPAGLFFASGFAALVYELVWTRQLVLLFGGTTYAVTTTVAAFMAGLGLGGYLGGRWCRYLMRPGRAYGLLELGVAVSGLMVGVLLPLFEPLYRTLYAVAGGGGGLLILARFLVSFAILMIPTTLMGATLPVLVQYAVGLGRRVGASAALLYGINTVGAAAGAAAAGFLLLPGVGMRGTTGVAVTVSLFVGLTAVILLGGRARRESPSVRPVGPVTGGPGDRPDHPPWKRRLALAIAGASGLAAMTYQIAWTRALIMSIGSSTYAFTCILAAFILGLGGGSLLIGRWLDRIGDPVRVLGWLQVGIGLTAVLLLPAYGQLAPLVRWLVASSGAGGTVFAAAFALAIAVTLAPTLMMGMTFPVVIRAVTTSPESAGSATGCTCAVNTCGTIVGALLAGFVLIRGQVLGVHGTVVAAATLNGLVGSAAILSARRGTASRLRAVAGLACILSAVLLVSLRLGRWDPVALSSAPYLRAERRGYAGRRLIYYGEGVDATVTVEGAPDSGYLGMAINGKIDASTNMHDMITQLLMGHLPAMLVDNGRQACVIGLGSGITVNAVAQYSSYDRIDCVEISEEVIKAAHYFEPYNGRILTDRRRLQLIRGDGRNHLLLTDRCYDLIVSQPSNPWISGEGNLFTQEFFRLCRRRLTDRGVACIWLHGYGMRVRDFRTVARTLCETFETVSLWEAAENEYLFLAGRHRPAVPLGDVLQRLSAPSVRADLYRAGLGCPGRLAGSFVTSGESLRCWAASAPIHTDDNALLEFSAPQSLYRRSPSRIPQALLSLHRTPFGTVIAVDAPNDPIQQRVVARARAAVKARRLRIEGVAMLQRHNMQHGVGKLLEACRADPGNVLAFGRVYRLRQRLGRNFDFSTLRLPTLAPEAPRSNPQLSAVTEWLVEQGVQATRMKRWEMAASYLAEARSIDPAGERAAILLAEAFARGARAEQALACLEDFLRRRPGHGRASYLWARLAVGRSDRSAVLERLDAALAAGAVTAGTLRSDEIWGDLRGAPAFRALLRRYPTP